ncbi:MAG: sigma-70 family RNA polymerase sigma factor [Chloroflexi bacterium]|nr:sigma-70 family RNA polymerase sigma factor [Chloroflexota bacterium]MDL1885844.1 sigma-70 family RNA polymerase sigma factor [Anaerolineae bacterium CFX8]
MLERSFFIPMTDRSNEQWLAELTGAPDIQARALEDLRQRLQRGIFYYLSRERSDLAHLSGQELGQMAEDLAQDATLRVIDNLDSFRGDSRFTTWATKIAVRLAISDLRRSRYKDFSLDGLTAEGEVLPASTGDAFPANAAPTPENATERADVMLKIERALREALTERQYQALSAVALQDVPLEIVAERLGTNRNALYKLLHDARRKLRQSLEAQGLTTDYMLKLFEE